ncbi:B-cell antigen receptor complex-associated protein beta chain [Kryptolebias marmoratus]|uniref:CD79b molecule n=1 Tax=Kryptolebias marmoratus TaxID=37003 RepID=A0A3Q3F5L8_KRYMA|nr:B-cell antigen receptor complex-associated protein beta chain [Kryptolebias marmoratus]
MRWTLAGCCGFALITLSAALVVTQKPRFYGVKLGRLVMLHCHAPEPNLTVSWHKQHGSGTTEVKNDGRIRFEIKPSTKNTFLLISKVRIEDSGVYFCKVKNISGPGTQLLVVSLVDPVQAQYRSQMKDGLMVLQGLLLAGCVAAILLRKQKVLKRRDSLYEEPEIDHIYEGLAIEACGGDLYEDLSAYAQPEGAEAPWE